MEELHDHRQIGMGTFLSYGALTINTTANLLLTPTMVAKLGDGQYGVYKTILAMISYLSVCKLGFGSAAVRYIAELRITKNKDKEQEFLAVIKWLNLFAIVLMLAVGGVLYQYIPKLYSGSFTQGEIRLASQLFLLLVLNVVISIINDIYDAVVTGYEEFIFQKLIDIGRSLIRTALMIAILFLWPMAIWLTVVDVFVNILLLTANYIKSKQLHVRVALQRLNRKQIDRSYYKGVIVFSFFVLLNTLINQMIWSTDSIIIGMRLDSYQVAIYSVGANVSSLFYTAATVVGNLLLPRAVRLGEFDYSPQMVTNFFVGAARFQAVIIFGILGAYCVLGKSFMVLWMGTSYTEAWTSSLLVMAGSVFPSVAISGHAVLKAQNRQGYFITVYFCIFLLNAIASYFVVPFCGINGAALMTCVSFVIGSVFFIYPYYHIKIKINMIKLGGNIWKIIIIFILMVLIGFLLTERIEINSWLKFSISCVMYCFLYIVMVWTFYMKKSEKKIVYKFCKGKE